MVWGIDITKCGTRLVSASHDETIRFWDPMSGKQVGASLKGHSSTIYCCAISDDDTMLATSSVSGGG